MYVEHTTLSYRYSTPSTHLVGLVRVPRGERSHLAPCTLHFSHPPAFERRRVFHCPSKDIVRGCEGEDGKWRGKDSSAENIIARLRRSG